jgi:predicted phage terminase large subunit-like protein
MYDLIDFARVATHVEKNKNYDVFFFHMKIAEELTRIIFDTNRKNLIINLAPRLGKSELSIKMFIPWVLSFKPNAQFIIACNTIDLARSHITEIRNKLESQWYRSCFPEGAKLISYNDRIKKGKKVEKSVSRSDFFTTLQGGVCKGIGIKGAISGFGGGERGEEFGGCIICDDLMQEKDFRSLSEKKRVYEWFYSTLLERRNSSKSTKIIIISSRISADDLSGTLLSQEPNEWNVVKFPTLIENKSICENVWDSQMLIKMRDSSSDFKKFIFYSRYQQEPTFNLTAIIKDEWWNYYEDIKSILPRIEYRIITMDTAYKNDEKNDESVIALWGFNKKEIYLLDMIHGRYEFPALLEKADSFYKKNNYFINNNLIDQIFIEDQASGSSLAQMLEEKNIPVTLWKIPRKMNKEMRVFESSRFLCENKVFIPKNEKFSNDLVEQSNNYSAKTTDKDDMIDAMTMAIIIWSNDYDGGNNN